MNTQLDNDYFVEIDNNLDEADSCLREVIWLMNNDCKDKFTDEQRNSFNIAYKQIKKEIRSLSKEIRTIDFG